ncbi:MAG: Cof-type HAD-IIB family hydrolase [Acutalibacteraceae bacterium]
MKLLAIDMDGTCVYGRGHISDRTINALRKAAKAGIEIVPTTGRTVTCMPEKIKNEPYIRYAVTSNGASVLNLKTKEKIYESAVPFDIGNSLINEFAGQKFGISAHIHDEYIVQGKIFAALGNLVYGKDSENSITVASLSDYIKEEKPDFEELQFYFSPFAGKEKARNILSKYADANINSAFGNIYVEVFSESATKGKGLSSLADFLKVTASDIACIGDGENDLSMFRASGMKFAMGNAVEELKSHADYILPSNREDGVAEAIEKYLL